MAAQTGREFLEAAVPATDLLFNLARRFAATPADAEDPVQETFTRAWAAWAGGERPRRMEPWLATTCLNAGRDRYRRRAARPESPWPGDYDAPADTDVEAEAISHTQRARLEEALHALPEPQRITITLMDLCGFTAAATAKIMKAPRGTVLARAHRGRKALARLVREEVDGGEA